MNRLNWRDFARQENPAASALMAKMKIAPEDRARVKLDCIRLLSTLRLNRAKVQVILGFIDTYLRLNDEEEKTYQVELEKFAPVEREKVMELTMSWKEAAEQKGLQQGLEQGLERGLEQGKRQGILSVVTRQIERRFGPLDAGARQRIGELSPDQLGRLGEDLLDFTCAADLTKWLQAL